MRGVYLLVMHIKETTLRDVGALGPHEFEEGFWVYVGSAMGAGSTSIEKRIARHFSRNKKTHWHIDYLLDGGLLPSFAIYSETEEKTECVLAQAIGQQSQFEKGPVGFGSSDCRTGCATHLFRYLDGGDVQKELLLILEGLGITGVVVSHADAILGKC